MKLASLGISTTALATLLAASVFAPSAQAAGRPNTIPAIREWTDGPGSYTFSTASRIVYNGAGLAGDAATFADDLLKLTGLAIPTVSGSSPSAGDIYLTLGASDPAIGNEGYLLTITDRVTISAQANAGAFYGTRTMLQLLKQSYTIAAGSARDWPDYPERGLMVDNGRKYFSVRWLKNHIRDLAYLKNNYFHWHLSDNEGFRIASESHPEIVTSPYLTKAEVAELITFAAKYHVTIVPEIDTPSHMKAILSAHPELRLGNKTDKLDITLPGAYALIGDLLDEYLLLFPGPYWHAGADEYLHSFEYGRYPQLLTFAQEKYGPSANAEDSFNYWNNWVNDRVKFQGKQLRAWNDALTSIVPAASLLDTDIVLEFWRGGPSPALSRGNRVMNANRGITYYVLGQGSYQFSPSAAYDWDPSQFDGGTIEPLHPLNLGAKAHIWCDNANVETEDEVATGIFETMRSLAQNEWGSPKLVSTYTSFEPIIITLGRAPGWDDSSTVMHVADLLTTDVNGTLQTTFTKGSTVYWSVRIVDQNNVVVSGASVTTQALKPNGASWTTLTATTGADGRALFSKATNRPSPTGTYTINVANVTKTGDTYNPAANVISSTTFVLQ